MKSSSPPAAARPEATCCMRRSLRVRSPRIATCSGGFWSDRGLPKTSFVRLLPRRGAGVVVERNRHDFPALLARARVSVSQAGYNTRDGRAAQRRAGGHGPVRRARNETEQRMRTRAPRGPGRARARRRARSFEPATLAAAVDRAALRNATAAPPFDMRGAERSAERILELAQAHAACSRHRDELSQRCKRSSIAGPQADGARRSGGVTTTRASPRRRLRECSRSRSRTRCRSRSQ